MKKILLDLSVPTSKESAHEYIAEKMGFPDYYGKNLDALYDELTSISEPTAVGIFMPIPELMDLDIDLMIFFDSICEVFSDAESSNASLAVIYGDLMQNPEYEGEMDDFPDEYEDDWDSEDDDEDLMPGAEPGDKDILLIDLGR